MGGYESIIGYFTNVWEEVGAGSISPEVAIDLPHRYTMINSRTVGVPGYPKVSR